MSKSIIEVIPRQSGVLNVFARTGTRALVSVDQDLRIQSESSLGWVVTEGILETFKIVNHHFCDLYEVSTTNGVVTLTDDIISYTAAIPGAGGFTLNGVFHAVEVIQAGPVTPSLITPSNEEGNVITEPVLVSTGYVTQEPDLTHYATRWQIATDAAFTNIIADVTSQTELDSWMAPALTPGVTYYARVQHQGWRA